jgi:hypothetical protein
VLVVTAHDDDIKRAARLVKWQWQQGMALCCAVSVHQLQASHTCIDLCTRLLCDCCVLLAVFDAACQGWCVWLWCIRHQGATGMAQQ